MGTDTGFVNGRRPMYATKAIVSFFVIMLVPCAALGDEKREYQCSEEKPVFVEHYRLTQYIGSDGSAHALWGREYREGQFAYCGFAEGHRFRLTDLNMWANRESVVDKGVWVYRGTGNACSEGHLLVFNERTTSVLVL